MLCYCSGQGRGGKQELLEVARYPSELSQSSSANQYCGPAYPSLVLPFNRIHVKFGGCSTKPEKLLTLLALPADVPLSLAFTHVLSKTMVSVRTSDPSSPSSSSFSCNGCSVQSLKALSVCAESLVKALSRLDFPMLLKEIVFHELASALSTLCAFANDIQSPRADFVPYALPNEFVQSTHQELLHVFESEASSFTSGKDKTSSAPTLFPPPGSIADCGAGKFSTYFQSILHFLLAISDYQQKFHGVNVIKSSSPPLGSAPKAAPSPAHPAGNGEPGKKAAKRARLRSKSKKEGTGSGGSGKKEPWPCTLQAAACLLREVAVTTEEDIINDVRPLMTVSNEAREASVTGSLPAHPNSRLLVVTGINPKLSVEAAQKAIVSVARSNGGLYKDQLYLPLEEETTPTELEDRAEPDATPPTRLRGCAVLELVCSHTVSSARSSLLGVSELQFEGNTLSVCSVSDSLSCGEEEAEANRALGEYLERRLVGGGVLSPDFEKALKEIFMSSLSHSEESLIAPTQVSGLLNLFLAGCAGSDGSADKLAEQVCSRFCKTKKEDHAKMDLPGFLQWALNEASVDGGRRVWLGLFACGYDLHFQRYRCRQLT